MVLLHIGPVISRLNLACGNLLLICDAKSDIVSRLLLVKIKFRFFTIPIWFCDICTSTTLLFNPKSEGFNVLYSIVCSIALLILTINSSKLRFIPMLPKRFVFLHFNSRHKIEISLHNGFKPTIRF